MFSASLTKINKGWVAAMPLLALSATGKTKGDACASLSILLAKLAGNPSDAAFAAGPDIVTCTKPALLIGLVLRQLRDASGQSLAQVSAKLGYKSRTQYARYERGEAVPAADTLFELLRAVSGRQFVVQSI